MTKSSVAALFAVFSALARAEVPGPAGLPADPATLLGAASTARAGATGASAVTAEALLQNPASAANTRRYAVSLGYLGMGDVLTASIVDTMSGPVGGGVYYMKRDLRQLPLDEPGLGSIRRMEERAGASAFGNLGPGFAIGVNVKYGYWRSYEGVDDRAWKGTNWNADVGGRYIITDQITFGLVGQNLLTDETGLHPRSVQGAIEAQLIPGLTVSGQLGHFSGLGTAPQGKAWSTSLEYATGNGLKARAGYSSNDAWASRMAGFGFGYDTKGFTIDYALRMSLVGSKPVTHTLGVTGYL